jgi:small-conductance mechanosensitive channel
MALKRHFLGEMFVTRVSNLEKAVSWDKILDALVVVSLFLTVFDVFEVKVGLGFASVLAFGGLGIVVFALASQGLASLIVSGLVLSTAKKVIVGDHIKLGDGIRGIVISLGWLYSEVRNYDESIIQIPNDQLIKHNLTNVSRLTKSQVEQKIRIAYKDLKKIPKLIEDIKNVIHFSCPTLIKDGSRPFRVVWTGYEDDHLTVLVTTHFNLSPLGEEYWNNRQKVLDAIALASEKNHVVLALPRRVVQECD